MRMQFVRYENVSINTSCAEELCNVFEMADTLVDLFGIGFATLGQICRLFCNGTTTLCTIITRPATS